MGSGRLALVLALLPRRPGRPLVARLTPATAPAAYGPASDMEATWSWWRCRECGDRPTAEHLADLACEHLQDGMRAGKARRERNRRRRAVQRGVPGAATVLLRVAADGALRAVPRCWME